MKFTYHKFLTAHSTFKAEYSTEDETLYLFNGDNIVLTLKKDEVWAALLVLKCMRDDLTEGGIFKEVEQRTSFLMNKKTERKTK